MSVPADCTWDGPEETRTIAHIIHCPGCTRIWPQITAYYGRPNPHCGCTALGPCEHHKDWKPTCSCRIQGVADLCCEVHGIDGIAPFSGGQE